MYPISETIRAPIALTIWSAIVSARFFWSPDFRNVSIVNSRISQIAPAAKAKQNVRIAMKIGFVSILFSL